MYFICDIIYLEIWGFIIIVIKMVTLVDVNIGLKIIDTLLIEIVDQYLIFMGEVDISLIPTTLTPITYVAMICSLGFSFSSLPVCENVHGDKIIGYSGHGYKRSYISSDAGDERGVCPASPLHSVCCISNGINST